MPWLVVLGEASWRTPDYWFRAGVHEVSDEIAERAEWARAQGVLSLLVLRECPDLTSAGGGPLTLEELRKGLGGVRLARPETSNDLEAPAALGPQLDFRCVLCPGAFPSRGALDRHVEFHHPSIVALS